MNEKTLITLTSEEMELILSSLRCDRVGTWGDGRQEKIDKLTNKIKRAEKVKKITRGSVAKRDCRTNKSSRNQNIIN